jgi:predicted Zn-dependent peptidase
MKSYFIMACCLFCTLTAAVAQSPNIKYEEYKLDNGLHVILHEDHSTPIVAVSVMYHVGSKNEDPSRTGFAHFFEHLLFEGTENIERGEYDKYVEKAGGTLNANTWFDRTFYYEILPSNQLALGLWLESERMLHAKVENVGIETQRQVVKEERRQRYDNQPYGTILEETLKRAFKEHPYQWPVIGSMEHLDQASESDYQNFYSTFYVPDNAVLSIAGDIDPTNAKMLIEKYFATIPGGDGNVYRPSIVEPPLGGEVRDTVYDDIQLPAVIQAYRIPAQGTDDFYAIQMLGNLLSKGQSSRMYKALVDKGQKAVAVFNFPLPLEDPGLSLTYGIASAGVTADDLESGMDAEIVKIQEELISDKEFEKLRNQTESDFINANNSVAGIAESLANYHMYYGDAALINTELERYMKVSKEDIQRVASKYFSKENRVVLHYLPKPPLDQ